MSTITSSVPVSGTPAPSSGNGHGRVQKRHMQDEAAASVQAAQFAMRVAQLLPDTMIGTETDSLAATQSTTGIAQISPNTGNAMNPESLPDQPLPATAGITVPTTIDTAVKMDGDYQLPAESTIYKNDAGLAGLLRTTLLPQLAVLADSGAQTMDGANHATAILPSDISPLKDIANHASTIVLADQDSTQTMVDATQEHESAALRPSGEMASRMAAATTATAPETATTSVAGLADEFSARVTQFEQAGGSWTGNARITFRSNVWNGASVHIAGSINLLAIVVTPPPLAQAAAASLSSGASASGLALQQEKQLAADLSRKLGRAISLHIAEAQETDDGPQAMGNATADSETR